MNKDLSACCIYDGKPGNLNQMRGLTKTLGINYEIKQTELRFPWSVLPAGIIPIHGLSFKNLDNFNFKSMPNIIISCGRRSILQSIYLKKKYLTKIFTIHILNPRISLNNFDLVITPKHDNVSGYNVINTDIALNHIDAGIVNEEKLKFSSYFKNIEKPICTVLVGGESRNHKFGAKEAIELSCKIKNLKKKINVKFIILFSRRTDESVKEILKQEFHKDEDIWQKSENPYLSLMGYSKYIICTSDSVSMISESISSKKSVFIYKLPSKKVKNRVEDFVNTVIKKNYVKLLEEDLFIFKSNYIDERNEIKKKIFNFYENYQNRIVSNDKKKYR